jgi:hypothetical protein
MSTNKYTMNHYCNDLNFSFPVVKDTFDYKKYKGTYHTSLTTDVFESKFVNLVDSLNLKITWIELFYRGPSDLTGFDVHTDSMGGDYVKLNWIFGGNNSIMQWYTVKEGLEKEPSKTALGSKYLSFDISEVDLAHRQSVRFPSIIQAGSPHNVYNPTEDRFCLSIMLRDKTTNNRLTMAEAVELFKNYEA